MTTKGISYIHLPGNEKLKFLLHISDKFDDIE